MKNFKENQIVEYSEKDRFVGLEDIVYKEVYWATLSDLKSATIDALRSFSGDFVLALIRREIIRNSPNHG